MHIEEIYSYFDSIPLTYLVDWLDIRPIYELGYLQVVELERVLELLELLLLLLLVLVHPQDSACACRLDISLVVGAILRHAVLLILIHRNTTLLAIS